MGQARTALLTVKRAWSSGNADACRHVCTDDYWRQLTSIFETYRGDGRRKVIDQLIVAQQQLQAIAIGDGRDRLTVRFTLSGHDYDVASDAIVSGFREVGQWIEDWTMQRDRAAGTLTTGRLETCPYCGAPAEVGDNGKCVHCGILMPGPTWDWLVAAVDRPVLPSGSPGDEQARVAGLAIAAQAVAGQAVADSGAPTIAQPAALGLDAIAGHDPNFDIYNFLPHARQLSVLLEQARAARNPGLVRAYTSDEFWSGLVAELQQAQRSGRLEVKAFLDIEQVEVEGASSEGGRDRLVIRVSGQSAPHVIDLRSGQLVAGDNTVSHWVEDLAFERSAKATTHPLGGFVAGFCPACGQRLDVDDGGHCRSCGAGLTSGDYDWILTSIRPVTSQGG